VINVLRAHCPARILRPPVSEVAIPIERYLVRSVDQTCRKAEQSPLAVG
jgi:hypothetical protein